MATARPRPTANGTTGGISLARRHVKGTSRSLVNWRTEIVGPRFSAIVTAVTRIFWPFSLSSLAPLSRLSFSLRPRGTLPDSRESRFRPLSLGADTRKQPFITYAAWMVSSTQRFRDNLSRVFAAARRSADGGVSPFPRARNEFLANKHRRHRRRLRHLKYPPESPRPWLPYVFSVPSKFPSRSLPRCLLATSATRVIVFRFARFSLCFDTCNFSEHPA